MTQTSNQFEMSREKGTSALLENTEVLECRVDSSESTALVAGQAVKVKDVTNDLVTVTAATDDADDILGFVLYSVKTDTHAADANVKVAIRGTVMNMEASAAIAAGANVEIVVTGQKILTVTNTGSRIIGKALNKAAADGDIIPVLVNTPTNDVVA